MPRRPNDQEPTPPGGQAAKRLQQFEEARTGEASGGSPQLSSNAETLPTPSVAPAPCVVSGEGTPGTGTDEASLLARKAKPRPPGGKALARLLHFNDARGFAKEFARRAAAPEAVSEIDEDERSDEHTAQFYSTAARTLTLPPVATQAPTEAPLPAPTPALAPLAAPTWRSLGPIYMPNGQTYGASRVDVSGRISTIAIDPGNANHILVGSAAGGVWESCDRGASWAPRTDAMPTLTVGAIAFNPSAPSMVYCGTGEGNFYWRLGAGLLRSIDGGTTWAMHATTPFVGQGFYDLVVDPANGNHLLAATTGGLYESADGGASWTRRRTALAWDISRTQGGASAEVLAACNDGLYRSTNGGTTWAMVTLPGSPASFNRLAVTHAPSNPAIAYAFGSGAPLIRVPRDSDPTHLMPTPYLWRRATAGGAFAQVTPPDNLITSQDWYDWFLAVAPDNAGQIYLGAISAYRGDLSGTTWTWIDIASKSSGDSVHPDQHAIAFDPADAATIYVGNDGGLFRSPNRGTNWEALNRGLAITEIEYLAQDYGSSRWLIGGTQDNGSIRYTGSAVWDHVADGDGGDCGVNRTTPDTVFHSYYGMGMERSTTRGGFGSFSWIGPDVPNTYQALFYPPLEVCNASVTQAGQSVFVSRNNGTTWTELPLPAGLFASAMVMATSDHLLVGTTNGRIFRITWTGSAWSGPTELTQPRAGAWISDIDCDPANLNRIWVTSTTTGGGRMFRSDNGGTSWQDKSAGLPNLPINAVEVDSSNNNRVRAAADLGVYQSLNGGDTWAAFSSGLPNVLVADLVFHPHARVLRAGTRNRGVWEIPVDGWLTAPICGTQWTGTLAANASNHWFTFNWPATWHVIWSVMPTTVKPGAPEISWTVDVERASAEYVTYWITVTNLTSSPISFEGRYAILSKY